MPVLNLRNVPDQLMRDLRAQAALDGKDFHPFCLLLLEKALLDRKRESPGWRPAGFEDDESLYRNSTINPPAPPRPAPTTPLDSMIQVIDDNTDIEIT